MNERIRELIIQTDEWLENNAQSNRYEREIKFAELIVRDCLDQIEQAIPDTTCAAAGPYKTAKIAATSRVRQQLGVEE